MTKIRVRFYIKKTLNGTVIKIKLF